MPRLQRFPILTVSFSLRLLVYSLIYLLRLHAYRPLHQHRIYTIANAFGRIVRCIYSFGTGILFSSLQVSIQGTVYLRLTHNS